MIVRLIDEGLLNHEMRGFPATAFRECSLMQERYHVGVEALAAAYHYPITIRIQRRMTEIRRQFARSQKIGDSAVMAKRLARRGRIIGKPLPGVGAQERVFEQLSGDRSAVLGFGDFSTTMRQNDLFVAIVSFWVSNDACEGRNSCAGAEQEQPVPLQQAIRYKSAGRFRADQNLHAGLEALQIGGERTIRYFDAKEFELVVVYRARDGIGPHNRPPIDFETDHRELTAAETKTRVSRRREAEQAASPVRDGQHELTADSAPSFRGSCAGDRRNKLVRRKIAHLAGLLS